MKHPWDRRLGVWWLAEDHPEALAVVASPSGPRTYAELTAGAHQVVHALRERGVRAGDTVALMAPNGVEVLEVALACQEAGWFFLPLNTFLTAEELGGILEVAEPAALLVHEPYTGLAAGERVAEVRRGHPVTMPADRVTGSTFVFTSGTTGRPKGIRRPPTGGDPSSAAHDAAVFGRAFDFRPMEGPQLVSTAMYHGGSFAFYMGALNVGHGLVIMERFDAEETLRLIERHRITTGYMVPTQFHRLLRLPPETREAYDTSTLHAIVHSAAPCPLELKQQMLDWWGPVIWETYGGMEGAATIAKPHRWLERPGTVGRAVRGVTLSIRDEGGALLPPRQQGLVHISRTGPSFEYVGDGQSAEEIDGDGGFTLGDIGYLDEDGYLFICDRAKDMLITGGVNVYPQEVEAAVATHPAVLDVAVIGIPDEEWGEQVKALVELVDGVEASAALEEELIAWCRERLASYKCPRSVEFRAALPRTDAGKLYKRLLRDEYWQPASRSV